MKCSEDAFSSNPIKIILVRRCNELDIFWAMVEHERWIASHKLMGYTYHPEKDCVRKYHESICPWNALDELTKVHDFKVVDTTIKLAYENK